MLAGGSIKLFTGLFCSQYIKRRDEKKTLFNIVNFEITFFCVSLFAFFYEFSFCGTFEKCEKDLKRNDNSFRYNILGVGKL